MDKLDILWKQIGLDDAQKEKMAEATLQEVLVNPGMEKYTFVLACPHILESDLYFAIEEKLKTGFAGIKQVDLVISPKEVSLQEAPSYYAETIALLSQTLPFATLFLDALQTENDVLSIEVQNMAEKHQAEEIIPRLNQAFHRYGFDMPFSIILNKKRNQYCLRGYQSSGRESKNGKVTESRQVISQREKRTESGLCFGKNHSR